MSEGLDAPRTDWPALPYDEWRGTRDTLHMYTQVIGKLRLALSPFEPEWANVPLYVTVRGLTSSPIPIGLRTVDAEFDLVDHELVIRSSEGGVERRPLGGSVADFYRDVMGALHRLGVEVTISLLPSEVPDPVPFPDDRTHDTYEAEHAARFRRALTMVDVVLKEHRARFRGRTTPVHFFWGTFDLAVTRYSGRPAEAPPGAGVIARVGGDAEAICSGWWPGVERFCKHLDQIHDVTPSGAGCADCLRLGRSDWVHLRVCQECGHVGCCDNSPGKHATSHYKSAGDPIIRSFEPGEDWYYCYPDDLLFELEGAPPAPSHP